VAGARPKGIFAAPSQNFETLQESLDKAAVTAEELEVNRALQLAAELLALQSSDDQRRRELVIVSDFQRTNWGKADFGQLPQDTQIQLESVADQETPANVAILSTRLRGRATPNVPAQLEVEVGNYTPAAQRVAVDVTLGDSAVRLEGLCAAGRTTVLAQDETCDCPLSAGKWAVLVWPTQTTHWPPTTTGRWQLRSAIRRAMH
jgi:hypothetical protein